MHPVLGDSDSRRPLGRDAGKRFLVVPGDGDADAFF